MGFDSVLANGLLLPGGLIICTRVRNCKKQRDVLAADPAAEYLTE